MKRENTAIAVIGALGFLAVGAFIGSQAERARQSQPSEPSQTQTQPAAHGLDAWKVRAAIDPVGAVVGRDGICRANPTKLRMVRVGMELESVRIKLGCQGELVNEMRLDGRYETHVWRDQDGNGVTVTFHNRRAYSVSFL